MPDIRFTPALPIDADTSIPLSSLIANRAQARQEEIRARKAASDENSGNLINGAFAKHTTIDPTTRKPVIDRDGVLAEVAHDPGALQQVTDFFQKQDTAARATAVASQEVSAKRHQAIATALSSIDEHAPPEVFQTQVQRAIQSVKESGFDIDPAQLGTITPETVAQAKRELLGPKEQAAIADRAAQRQQNQWKLAHFRTTKRNGAASVSEERGVLYNSTTGEILDQTTRAPIDPRSGTLVTDGASTPVAAGEAIPQGRLQGVVPNSLIKDGKLDPAAFYHAILPPFEGHWNPRDNNGQPTMYGFNKQYNPDVNPNWTLDDAVSRAVSRYWDKSGAASIENPALAAAYSDTYFISPGMAKSFLAKANGDPQRFLDLRREWEERLIARGSLFPEGTRSRTEALGQLVEGLGGGRSSPSSTEAPRGSTGALSGPDIPMPDYVASGNGGGKWDGKLTESDDFLAHRLALGDNFTQLGLSGQGNASYRRALMQRATEIQTKEMKITPGEAIVFAARNKAGLTELAAIGRISALVTTSEATAQRNADQALTLLGKGAARTGVPLFNRWVQAGRKAIKGDPDLGRFEVATETLTMEYAKVMTGGGTGTPTSDAAREHARSLLDTARTPEDYRARIQQLKIDMDNRSKGIEAGRQDVYSRLKNGQPVPPAISQQIADGKAPGSDTGGQFEYARSKRTGRTFRRPKGGNGQWQPM